ncbi:MAG TPA: acyltransferase family protein [Lachnospiraceae bacterium]|nr:acyltransferase family protein [Lachnospiraceae bacterium]
MTDSRIKWIDMAKGLGIILVIVAHLQPTFFTQEIYTFHMPLFFFLSGYVFSVERYKLLPFIKRKSKTILVPYFLLGIPMILFTFLQMIMDHKVESPGAYGAVIIAFLLQKKLWTIWFLTCLFLTNLLFYFIARMFKSNLMIQGIVVLAFASLGLYYYRNGGTPLLWNVDVCLTALPFFYGGYVLKNIRSVQTQILRNDKFSILYFILFLAINVATGIWNKSISGHGLEMFYNQYAFEPLTYLSAFSGILWIIILSKALYIKGIAYLGKHSLVYFSWHQVMMIPLLDWCFHGLSIFQDQSAPMNDVRVFVSTIIIIAILTPVDMLIRRTRLKCMVGG